MNHKKAHRIVIGLAAILLLIACGRLRPSPTPTPVSTPTALPTYTPTPLPPASTQTPVVGPVSERIGERGGEVAGPGGARLVVPEGALGEEVEVRIAEAPAAPGLPAGHALSPAGPAYEVTLPKGTELQAMVDLVLPLQRQEGADESRYTVFRWEDAAWSDVGGFVEGEFIRAQVGQFSLFRPVYGVPPRRPLKFRNNGPYDASVRVWTYKPTYVGAPALVPGGSWICRAPGPPLAVDRTVCRVLPLGGYSFCVEFRMKGQRWHYIHDWLGGVGEEDPRDCSLAETLIVRTDIAQPTPGRCGAPPTATPVLLATPTPTTAGPTATPAPIQTGGEGVIITLKPGSSSHLPADGKSQLVLLIDVDPGAPCWGGRDVMAGQFDVLVETSLGTVPFCTKVFPEELPAEVVLTAGTSAGRAVIKVVVAWCPREGVMVYGVCDAPGAQDVRCEGWAIVVIQDAAE